MADDESVPTETPAAHYCQEHQAALKRYAEPGILSLASDIDRRRLSLYVHRLDLHCPAISRRLDHRQGHLDQS